MRILVFVFLVFLPSSLFAKTLVLKGTLGKLPIIMELHQNGKKITGRYAYKKNLVGIYLEGGNFSSLQEAKFPEREGDYKKVEAYEIAWNARFKGELKNGEYKGVWTMSRTKRSLKFKLKVVPGESKNVYEETIREWMIFKRTNPKLKILEGFKLRVFIEKYTKVLGYRFTNIRNKKAQKKINAFLEERHRRNIIFSHECIEEGYTNNSSSVGHSMMRGSEDFSIHVYKKRLLEITFSGSIFCGGAHPSNYQNNYIFDLKTGEELDLNTLFNVYKSKDEYELSAAFKSILGIYLDKKHQCIDDIPNVDAVDSIEIHLSKPGFLGVRLQGMGHAAFICELDDIATIPLKALKSIAKPEAGFFFRVLPSER